MKRNISDLLDAYSDESVDLDGAAPLSSSRIKELTMSKITQEPSHKRRIPVRFLVAAAVVAALSVSALAANYVLGAGTLLQDYFAEEGETLSPGQVEVMDEMGKTFEGGVTSNGTTMTPIAALADEHVYYLRLRVEAPEDVVLPDLDPDVDGYYQLSGMGGEGEHITFVPEEDVYESFGWSLSLDWLPDSDPTDNVKEVVLRCTAAGDEKFNDGVSKLLTIHGLWIQSPDKEYTQILSGEFTFDIGMYYESKVIALDCEGVTYYNQTYGFANRLESLELSPLTLSYRFQSTMLDNDWYGPGLGPLQIVLKDGTVFYDESRKGTPRSNASVEEPKFDIPVSDDFVTSHEDYILFDTPLDLTQVDYVQYGEYKIPVVIE